MSSNTDEATKTSPQSAGAWLREARQKQGLHIGALAALLKVPQSKLEALEADRWSELTDMTFVRALAKAVCRALKVDASTVLAMLPRGGDKELDVSLGINTPFREYGSRNEASALNVIQRKAVWGPLLLLAAAAGVWFLPSGLLNAPTTVETATPAPVLAVAELPASEPVLLAAPQQQQPAASAVATLPTPASAPASSAAPAPIAAAPRPAAPVPAPAASPVVASAGQVPLAIKLSADSWVRVTDGSGQVLLSKLLKVGDDQQLAGTPPLKITVGNVAGTQLLLRGSPVDLASRNKDNVAVLELN